jgi:hypothetical protein
VALTLVLAASLSCNSDDSTSGPASNTLLSTPTSASPGELPAGDPSVTVVNVVQACREKDGDRLRSFVAATVPDADVQALFDRGTDARLESQTLPEIEGGRATVSVRLEVRRDGEVESVDRDWELQRDDDGVWRLTSLPDCF